MAMLGWSQQKKARMNDHDPAAEDDFLVPPTFLCSKIPLRKRSPPDPQRMEPRSVRGKAYANRASGGPEHLRRHTARVLSSMQTHCPGVFPGKSLLPVTGMWAAGTLL